MPSRAHSSVVRRTLATPRRCPSIRGRFCRCAQRPLPSMMMAMCRGQRSAGHPAKAGSADMRHGIALRIADSDWRIESMSAVHNPIRNVYIDGSSGRAPGRRTPSRSARRRARRRGRGTPGRSPAGRRACGTPVISSDQPGSVSYTGFTRRRSSTWLGKRVVRSPSMLVRGADLQLVAAR